MPLEKFKKLLANKQLLCPQCKAPIQRFEKFTELASSVWDGAGDTEVETAGSKVTLICGNENCPWKERTEYWSTYLKE